MDTQPRETQAFGEMDGTINDIGAISSAAWLVKEGHLVCIFWLSIIVKLSYIYVYVVPHQICLEMNSYVFYQRVVEELLSPPPAPAASAPSRQECGGPRGGVEGNGEGRGEKGLVGVDGVAEERKARERGNGKI